MSLKSVRLRARHLLRWHFVSTSFAMVGSGFQSNEAKFVPGELLVKTHIGKSLSNSILVENGLQVKETIQSKKEPSIELLRTVKSL